ncbi:unnamed protein product, partial [Tilletia controversa]
VVHNSIESGDMQLIGEAYYHRLFFFVLDRVAPAEKTHEKNGENGLAEWGDIQTTTTKAYHPDIRAHLLYRVIRPYKAGSELGAAPPTRRLQTRPTLSSARQVELDLVMHPQTPLWLSHDISQDLQDRIEDLPMVERAFIRSELGAAPPTRRLQPRPTLSSARQVEVDLVMHPQTPLWLSHDISQDLQDRIEDLLMVERAFIHVDHETDHRPEHRKNV